ncbi:hypothetical protein M011DRAFT_461207 [Sporormia fimetaria CBS 119925]|uniref:Uncharacterized protein n=1 Tax=Sporormia fimetaria CBS 119925 TaxID=1340428 RepID=A0A6A6V210_9PLEO|nr:hypothetical protein M011DRAFT_461207 [Sporormia fimetaria CBS 119925]
MATALVTFLFDCPVPAHTVELLGSWDNFGRSYHLRRDPRRSPRTWAGCFSFVDIFCDGNLSNLGAKRSGALKAGGTYWYYYKVNDGDEVHNPSEPSTTHCPLLPGQRLNILEVPMEINVLGHALPDAFTRNPEDRYLTPEPPKARKSPRIGDLCNPSFTVSLIAVGAPRSATYPREKRSLSPNPRQRSKSANSSPQPPMGLFDLKGMKAKVVHIPPRARSRSPAREIKIGAPVLVSTTAEDMDLVPRQQKMVKAAKALPLTVKETAERLKAFNPLRSNPIDCAANLGHRKSKSECPMDEAQLGLRRARSHGVPERASEIQASANRDRANSSDTRRTTRYCTFSNEPWVTSPSFPEHVELPSEPAAFEICTPPRRSKPALQSSDERPTSRRGGDSSDSLRSAPLEKDLPALPKHQAAVPMPTPNVRVSLIDRVARVVAVEKGSPAEGSIPEENDTPPSATTTVYYDSHSTLTSLSPLPSVPSLPASVSGDADLHSPTLTHSSGSPTPTESFPPSCLSLPTLLLDGEHDTQKDTSSLEDAFLAQVSALSSSTGASLVLTPVLHLDQDHEDQSDLISPSREVRSCGPEFFAQFSNPNSTEVSRAPTPILCLPPMSPDVGDDEVDAERRIGSGNRSRSRSCSDSWRNRKVTCFGMGVKEKGKEEEKAPRKESLAVEQDAWKSVTRGKRVSSVSRLEDLVGEFGFLGGVVH